MKTQCVTLGIGSCLPLAKVAADRFQKLNGIETKLLTDADIKPYSIRTPSWIKAWLWDIVDSSIERVIWMDADIFPIQALGALPTAPFSARLDCDTDAKTARADPTFSTIKNYFNAGFFVCTREAIPAFNDLKSMMDRPLLGLDYQDQSWLNLSVQNRLGTFNILPKEWAWLFNEGMPPPREAKMVHYAGVQNREQLFGKYETATVLPNVIDYRCCSRTNPSDNHGIGDTITGLYILRALAKANPCKRVRYRLNDRNVEWAKLWWDDVAPELDGTRGEAEYWSIEDSYVQSDLAAERLGLNRHQEIAQRLGLELEPFKALSLGRELDDWAVQSLRAESKPVVILCPFSTSKQRSWPYHHWVQLQQLLANAGVRTVAMAGPGGDKHLEHMPGKVYWAQDPKRTVALFQQASMVCGSDSGLVHVAGLLGIPALAICAPTLGKIAVGWYPSVEIVQAPGECTGCYWKIKRGFRHECGFDCELMWDLKPKFVADAILGKINLRKKTALAKT